MPGVQNLHSSMKECEKPLSPNGEVSTANPVAYALWLSWSCHLKPSSSIGLMSRRSCRCHQPELHRDLPLSFRSVSPCSDWLKSVSHMTADGLSSSLIGLGVPVDAVAGGGARH